MCFLIPLNKQQMQTSTNQEFECKISIDSFSVLLLLSHHVCFSSIGLALYDMIVSPFILLWDRYLLSTQYAPGTVLGIAETMTTRRTKSLASWNVCLVAEINNKQVNTCNYKYLL